MKIALFTPFSPEMGGGSVQIRSVLSELGELDIEWFYLAEKPVAGERRRCLGKPLSTSQFVSDLSARSGFLPGSRGIVRELARAITAEVYWVVAHNEGVSVASELVKMGKRVHLTVHDDPVCLFRWSRRYRLLAPLMTRVFGELVGSVESLDVISQNMASAYAKKYEVESFPLYRYVAELPRLACSPQASSFTVGHIGKVYRPEPLELFVRACRAYAAKNKVALKIVQFGSSPELDTVAAEHPGIFENRGEVAECDALPVLASCDFLYAMYPDGKRFECFRRMSLPMKLSTYIQAQRPIFAQTPEDAGLAEIVREFRLGKVCGSKGVEEICGSIQEIVKTPPARENFEEARRRLMGRKQLEQLRNALSSSSVR